MKLILLFIACCGNYIFPKEKETRYEDILKCVFDIASYIYFAMCFLQVNRQAEILQKGWKQTKKCHWGSICHFAHNADMLCLLR